jgi:predicted HicB family RNase H-like nuclease
MTNALKGSERWKRNYRVAKERWQPSMIRLDKDDHRLLKEHALKKETSIAELIRTYIEWGLENDR